MLLADEQRRETRFKLIDSVAVFDGETHRLDNWSRGGACILGYVGPRRLGERFPIALEVSTSKGRIRLVGDASLAWRDGRRAGLQWDLSDGAAELEMILALFLGDRRSDAETSAA